MNGNTGVDDPGRFVLDCKERELFDGARRVLVACSGGADSTALAILLSEHFAELGDGAPELYLGHVNHALRGADSDEDEVFAGELARKLGAEFLSVRLQGTAGHEHPASLSEGQARELRYAVYRDWANGRQLDCIATGHHRDDQQETLLLRLCRGTGVAGLAGIPASRPLGGTEDAVKLVRPLLDWSRSELLAVLEAREQPYRTDETNRSLEIPRNRVRHEVLPLLEEHVHPGVRSSLGHLAEQAAGLQGDLESLGARALAAARLAAAGEGVFLSLEELRGWPRSVRREVYAAAARELASGTEGFFSRRQFESAEDVLDPDDSLAAADLGGGLRVELAGGSLHFSRAAGESAPPLVSCGDISLQIDGDPVAWGGWSLSARREPWRGPGEDTLEEWVDESSLDGHLLVRGRLPGDRVWPLGAPGSKKLKEFLRERGVPAGGRDGIPLVVSAGEIVWVVGQRLCQPFSIAPGGASAVRLHASRLEDAS